MSNIFLEKAIFANRAPFERLELDFAENEIAVLSGVNGKGKTTVLSHIVDAFYEIARPHFQNEFAGRENKYYRLSSSNFSIDQSQPSIVYFRFSTGEGEKYDYVDIRGACTSEQYDLIVTLQDKIPHNEFSAELIKEKNTKHISTRLTADIAKSFFAQNILTYFPSYRYEEPGYLNDPYKLDVKLTNEQRFSGNLVNPIESITSIPKIHNWILDILFDMRGARPGSEGFDPNQTAGIVFESLNEILSANLSGKIGEKVRFGAGSRRERGTRLCVCKLDGTIIYPTITNLSAGESGLLSVFGEILRQSDMLAQTPAIRLLPGIVLIDEIDKHLHIKLQKEVLPKLLNLFPNIQFIVASHSPFFNLGLAETLAGRSKIISLDTGLSIKPEEDDEYRTVYQKKIAENQQLKTEIESFKSQIDSKKELQIITEGKNLDHIERALQVLESELLPRIKLIRGAEGKSGDGQLKNAYEIMSKVTHAEKFLFIWDFDATDKASAVKDANNFYPFSFIENRENTKSRNEKGEATGIENLYPDSLFTEDVYKTEKKSGSYGAISTIVTFNKIEFLKKIQSENNREVFVKFNPLIEKIKTIINPAPAQNETANEETPQTT